MVFTVVGLAALFYSFMTCRPVGWRALLRNIRRMWIISRRILSAALAVGFVCTAVCGPAIAAQKTLSTDIVIVGAGSAGLTAAVQAAEKGANVVLLEKNFFVGGASNFAEGIFAVESELNRLRSDTLTREEAFKHAREMHMYEVNVPMMRDYIYGSADNVDWFMKHGVKFDVIRMTPWEEATWHVIDEYKGKNHGAALVANLKDQCDKLGVTTLTGTPAESLITDKSGAVVGVKAKSKTDDYTINAKAVILASGSISDSNEKVAEWAHRDAKHWHSSVNVNKTGDGISMAVAAGAQRGPVSFVAHLSSEGKGIKLLSNVYTTAWQPAALWVNSDGSRFVNEDVAMSFSQAANAVYNQLGHTAWSIFDESQVDYMIEKGVDSGVGVLVPVGAKLTKLKEEIKTALDEGSDSFFAASSVSAMAKKLGVPTKNLEAAVTAYNRGCAEGHDGEFFKDVKYMRPINTKKLYAIRLTSAFFTAFGGLNVNRDFEVLNTKNQPIKGLYATGLEVSRMIGHTYTTWTSGYAFGFSCYSGRHAALNAVEKMDL